MLIEAHEDLMDAGAEVYAVIDVGMTALMLLAQRGKPDEITTLLKAGADAQKKNSAGRWADRLGLSQCNELRLPNRARERF